VGPEASYPDSQLYRYDNVITLRTFSKAYGLAGLRIGYGLANEALIANLLKVKLPFEPSSIAMAAGLAALEDSEFLAKTVNNNGSGLAKFYGVLSRLGIRHIRCWGYFVMVDLKEPQIATNLSQDLLERGILIRPLKAFGLPSCVRISVGLPEENEAFVSAFQEVLSGKEMVHDW
jgi:histidinol-phosphate aminotransferase